MLATACEGAASLILRARPHGQCHAGPPRKRFFSMQYHAIVRYGAMRHLGNFRAEFSGLRMGDKCIVRTDRGVEVGNILSPVDLFNGEKESSGILGTILRRMTVEDQKKSEAIQEDEEPREFDLCKKRIQERALPMRLVSVEHLFGGTKIIFYFLAEGRVDFRDLVKNLATEYHTRIEMRQIGVRDEARLLADYEHCGRELCCKTFIKDLEPVTMKMAKNQKATLDPSKISGRCGRLMCCLRFEDSTYDELKRKLPRRGTRVKTSEGEGEVIGSEVLSQLVRVEFPDHRELPFPLEQITVLGKGARKKGQEQAPADESNENE